MDKSIVSEISALRGMTVAQLRVRWLDLYGEETRSRNKDFLFRRCAWKLQELRVGGLSDVAQARLAELAPAMSGRPTMPPGFVPDESDAAPPRPAPRRDPRLPGVGSTLVRKYKGVDVRVHVCADGFEWNGRHFDSLSEVALAVTGSKWNGWLFFGLTDRKRAR